MRADRTVPEPGVYLTPGDRPGTTPTDGRHATPCTGTGLRPTRVRQLPLPGRHANVGMNAAAGIGE